MMMRTMLRTASIAVLCTVAGLAPAAQAADLITLTTSLEGAGQDIMTTSVRGYEAYWTEVFDWIIEQDETGALVPGLATDWEVSEDGLVWTFQIREGVLFHNGNELTGEDVAFSWNRLIFDPASTSALTGLREVIDQISAEGNVVTVSTKVPQSGLIFVFARPGGVQGAILNKSYFDEVGPEAASRHPIGTGPYKFVRLNGTQSVELEAFTDENRSDWQKQKSASFDTLTIMAVPEPSTRIAMLRAGQADVIQLPFSAIEEVERAGFRILTTPYGNFSNLLCVGVSLNPESPCDDIRVREALNIAIDRQGIADAVYLGYARPNTGFFSGPGTFGSPPDLEPYPFDPERAQQLLAEAGYSADNPLRLEIAATVDDGDFPNMPTLAEAIYGDYQKIGIDVTISVNEWGAHELRLEEGTLPGQANNPDVLPVTLWMRGMDNRFNMIAEQIQSYTSSGPKGKAAWSEENLPEMRERLLAIQAEFDPDQQRELFYDYTRWMAENFYQLPLLTGDIAFAISDKVASWDLRIAGRPYVHNQWSMKPAD